MKKSHKITTTITLIALTLLIIIIIIVTNTLNTSTQTTYHGVPIYNYKIVQTYPHDPTAFTQGLIIDEKGNLIESTGLNGASSLRRVYLKNNKNLQQIDLPYEYFGEGIAIVDDKIIQLTWQNRIAFIYNKDTFKLIGNFTLNTEGWGLTYDGTHLIMSDGTSNLYFIDPNTYQTINTINVHDTEGSVDNLNELEYINGTIYANIWHNTKIAIINPTTGQIEAYIDLKEIAQPHTKNNSEAVLNGIAYNTQTNQLYITGKNWPTIYEIKIK
ncbi:MAG: glutaminyl-peptide cyclotransferase [Nitrososphaerota archaeon]|jgi:glutamine cyclotransferase|nr:glutaminyl-peptide cyclotransferase [Nitrososphaerota archaeon]